MNSPITIVTAASSNHFRCLQSLLWTVSKFEPQARVIVYDLGLSRDEHALLNDAPPFYLANWELRTFDFTKYPAHFDMSANGGRMAFRPTVLAQIAHELAILNSLPSTLLWLDAGCQLREPLETIRACIHRDSVYCPCAPGAIGQLLYPTSHAPLGIMEDLLSVPIRDAGTCGFETSKPEVMALLDRWATIALNPVCTAPTGSDRRTHRQDAVFAVLLNQAAKAHNWYLEGRRLRGLAIKQDNLSLKETQYRVGLR